MTAKADLTGAPFPAISGTTGAGIDTLLERIQTVLEDAASGAGLATHARHAVAMELAVMGLEKANALLESGPDLYDLAAAELRIGIRALEALVGRIDAENLLDEIFASFCLGK